MDIKKTSLGIKKGMSKEIKKLKKDKKGWLSWINPIPVKGDTIKGYAHGVWFAIISTVALSLVASLLLWKLPLPINIYIYLLAYAVTASITIPFCFGKRFWDTVESGHKGVPTPMGGRTDRFDYNEGLIWKPPEPLMGYIPVDIREITHDMKGTIALSKDLIPVIIDFSMKTMVTDPYAYTWIDKPKESITNLSLREARGFIGGIRSIKAPHTKDLLRKHIKNQCESEMKEEKDEETGEIKKRSWGMIVPRVFVTDIRLPKALENAYTQKQIERALAIAKLIKISNLRKGVRAIRANKFLAMNDQEIINAVQTEYGTADRMIVDGSDPISRAAAIFMSGKKELKEEVKDEK